MVNIDPLKNPFPIDWPAKNKMPGMDPVGLIQLIESEGVEVTWESAAKCPCSVSASRYSARSDCPQCHGKGYVFHHAQETLALIQQFSEEHKMINQPFIWDNGDIMMTMRAEHCPARYDRITLTNARMNITATMARKAPRAVHSGDTAYEPLNVPIFPKTITKKDANRVEVVTNYDVFYLQGQDATTLEPLSVLVEGTDYTVDYDSDGLGRLNWAIGDLKVTGTPSVPDSDTPAVGALFSISYFTRPVYRVSAWTHTVRETTDHHKNPGGSNLPMPVQFKASLEVDLRDAVGGGT